MKTTRAWITATVMAGALFTLPAPPAGAATNGGAATTGAPSVAAAEIGPHHKATVHPRVSCGDSSGRTAGFDGEIGWGGVGSEVMPGYIDVDGRLWSSCSGSAYLYVSYTNFGSSHNPQIGSVGAGKNVGVNWSTESHFASYGNIAIDVCTRSHGWRCGAPVHV